MKSRDSTAGNGHEHIGPHGKIVGMKILKCEFRNSIAALDNAEDNARSHNDENTAEDGIYTSYNLIYRPDSRNKIVDQDNSYPECPA